jgi:hypothetical protein
MQFDVNMRLYEYWHEQVKIRKKRCMGWISVGYLVDGFINIMFTYIICLFWVVLNSTGVVVVFMDIINYETQVTDLSLSLKKK